MNPILEAALKARAAGVSAVPTKSDKTPALSTWKARETTLPSETAIRGDFQNPEAVGFATIGGEVSGNLETLDFDLAGEFYPAFEAAVNSEAPGLLVRLAMQRTMSGGRHIRSRCPTVTIPGNSKLAHKRVEVSGPGVHTFGGKQYTAQPYCGKFFIYPCAIETRGEGGYAVCAPSPGYVVIQAGETGEHLNPPAITFKEREVLLRCARALDEKPPEEIRNGPRSSSANAGGKRPGDDYNERADAFERTLDLLLKNNWTIHQEREALVQLRRPGGKAKISATLYRDRGVLRVFSGNAAPFEEEKNYYPFSIFALLEHGADFTAAARELGRQGYGEPSRSATREALRSYPRPEAEKSAPATPATADFEDPPFDFFGDPSLTGIPPWPADACPAVIEDFAQDEAARIGVDIPMVAIPAIVCAAVAIDDGFQIQPKEHDTTWREAPRIWAAIVADPGQKKTPAINAAFAPLRELEKQSWLAHKEDAAEYERRMKPFREAVKKKNGDDLGPEPEKPIHRRRLVDDITVEALRRILAANPAGVGCVKDELSGWIKSFDIYKDKSGGGKDRADYCELYQGGHKLFDRVNDGFVFCPNWGASICGGIQPGVIARTLGKITEDGLLARFLVVFAGRNGSGLDRPPNRRALGTYHETIRALHRMTPKDGDEVFRLSPGAVKLREAVVEITEAVQALPDTTDALRGHLNKYEAVFCRLALVFHITEAAATGRRPAPSISEKTAEAAGRLLLDFLFPNSMRFYRELVDAGDRQNHARWVAGYILAHRAESVGRDEILGSYRAARDPALFAAIMRSLEAGNWIDPIKFKKDGTVTRWTVNPAAHRIFSERAEAERQRRELEKKKIAEAVALLRAGRVAA